MSLRDLHFIASKTRRTWTTVRPHWTGIHESCWSYREGIFGIGYGEGGGLVGWIEVTLIEFVGQAVPLNAGFEVELRDSWPFTTTQLPIGGYEDGKLCNA